MRKCLSRRVGTAHHEIRGGQCPPYDWPDSHSLERNATGTWPVVTIVPSLPRVE
jgi:hypothetical protein